MSDNRDLLEEKIQSAAEAEVDLDRHHMEEAVLATLAALGPNDPFNLTFFSAFNNNVLQFCRADLAAIANALHEAICLQGIPADPVLLREKLGDTGRAILGSILAGEKAVEAAVAERYIARMHRQDKIRAAESIGRQYLKRVADIQEASGEVEQAFADLTRDVFDLARSKKLLRDHPVERYAAADFLETLNARRTDGRAYLGLDCGFNHLNEVLNGLTEGLFIFAGAPSCGKTTLIKQIADMVAENEKVPVLFYSFEQSAEELRIKSLARLASVDSRSIWKGRTGSADWDQVEKASADYLRRSGPYLTIIEAGRTDTIEAIRAAALMKKRSAGGGKILLIIDYLQIIPAGKDCPDTVRERIDWNLSELRRLSRDLQSPVLVISAQNREAYKDNNTPTLASLKESGGIEYSADGVICLWRNKKESEQLTKDFTRLTIRVEAHVLKNRNGELAKVNLDFTPAWAFFTEGSRGNLSYSDVLG